MLMIMWRGIARLESYMQFPVPQITTLLLLVHLGFGCCSHHTHTHANACEAIAESGSCGFGHHGFAGITHHHDRLPLHDGSVPHQHRCDGVQCVFARLSLAPKLSDASVVAVGSWLSAVSLREVGQTDSLLRHRLDHFQSDAGPPLRVHLVYQVLLI